MITVAALLAVVAIILCILHLANPPRAPLWVSVIVLALAVLAMAARGLIVP